MVLKKIAIVSDVLMDIGGAENVVETLLELYPQAELYSLLLTKRAQDRLFKINPEIKIHLSVFQWWIKWNLPLKFLSIIKILSWIYWEFLDLNDFDLVISSSHSFMSKNVKRGSRGLHLSYIHTPPRYLYDEYNELNFIRQWPVRIFIWPIIQLLRKVDRNGAKRPDIIVVNSKNVQNRVKKYYNRDSIVVYPPVEIISNYKLIITNDKKDYYVCLSRLVKQKGIELAVRACVKNNLNLVVIGNGPELINLKEIANRKVRFVVNANEGQKYKWLSGAKALIYTSIDEDFGIVPVEALACGIPVIAFNSGGVRESVSEGMNGVLFDEFSEKGLLGAINRLSIHKISKTNCLRSAEKYSREIFIHKFQKIINDF